MKNLLTERPPHVWPELGLLNALGILADIPAVFVRASTWTQTSLCPNRGRDGATLHFALRESVPHWRPKITMRERPQSGAFRIWRQIDAEFQNPQNRSTTPLDSQIITRRARASSIAFPQKAALALGQTVHRCSHSDDETLGCGRVCWP